MTKLARTKEGKLLARIPYYSSSKAKGPFHIVFPKKTGQTKLPKTAEKVRLHFFEKGTMKGVASKSWVKPQTARKLKLIW